MAQFDYWSYTLEQITNSSSSAKVGHWMLIEWVEIEVERNDGLYLPHLPC